MCDGSVTHGACKQADFSPVLCLVDLTAEVYFFIYNAETTDHGGTCYIVVYLVYHACSVGCYLLIGVRFFG